MTTILGMAEVLSESELGEEDKKYVNILKDAGDSLIRIINDILDFSQLESGRVELQSIDFNLEYLINDILVVLL